MIAVEKNETSWIGSFWLVNVVLLFFVCVVCWCLYLCLCLFCTYKNHHEFRFFCKRYTLKGRVAGNLGSLVGMDFFHHTIVYITK